MTTKLSDWLFAGGPGSGPHPGSGGGKKDASELGTFKIPGAKVTFSPSTARDTTNQEDLPSTKVTMTVKSDRGRAETMAWHVYKENNVYNEGEVGIVVRDTHGFSEDSFDKMSDAKDHLIHEMTEQVKILRGRKLDY